MDHRWARRWSGCGLWLVVACGPAVGGDDADGSGDSTASDDASTSNTTVTTTTTTTVDETGTSVDPDTTTNGGCATALPDDAIETIDIGAGIFGKAPVGGDLQLSIVQYALGGFPEPVDTCVEWSVAPGEGAGVSSDGLLSIDASVAPGTVFTVTADVESGRKILMRDITAYVPIDAPIVRTWSEVSRTQCGTGDSIPAEPVINELALFDTGDFWVTWQPFETYVDYWGTYTYDAGSGALEMTVDGGNYVPGDVDTIGTATVVDGEVAQLVLTDIWLGTDQKATTAEVACGHVFE